MLSCLHLVPQHQVPAKGADIPHTAAANQLHVVGKLLAIPASRCATHLMEGKNVLCTMWNRKQICWTFPRLNSPVFLRGSLSSSPQSRDGIRDREGGPKDHRGGRNLEKIKF